MRPFLIDIVARMQNFSDALELNHTFLSPLCALGLDNLCVAQIRISDKVHAILLEFCPVQLWQQLTRPRLTKFLHHHQPLLLAINLNHESCATHQQTKSLEVFLNSLTIVSLPTWRPVECLSYQSFHG